MIQVKQNPIYKSAVNSLIVTAIVLSLIFIPTIQDPFNSGKQLALFILSSWLLGYLLATGVKKLLNKAIALTFVLLTIFILACLISAINAPNIYLGLVGENLRRNGMLTYLCMYVIFIASALYFRINDLKKIIQSIYVVAFSIGFYGAIQAQGLDFIKWNNPYNSIIGTLGNPNFASALMSILASTLTIYAFGIRNLFFKFTTFLLILILFYDILQSQSRQGLVSFTLGFGSGLYFILLKYGKRLSYLYLSVFMILILFSILGMLQKGPLSLILYKDSVSVRGFYWRAAISMFKDFPIFGVGMDSYGQFFKQYREIEYPLRYGYNITSTNAHSLPLQILSTTGIFGFLSYVIFVGFVFVLSCKRLPTFSNSRHYISLIAIFSGWIAFQAQSFISIDQIGLSVWNWIFAGILIAILSRELNLTNAEKDYTIYQQANSKFIYQRILSSISLLLILIPTTLYFRCENEFWKLRSIANSLSSAPNDLNLRKALDEKAEQIKNMPFQDPYYVFLASTFQSDFNLNSNGILSIQNLLSKNPRNLDYLTVLSFYATKRGDFDSALNLRKQISIFDPLNASNFLEMGLIYKNKGNYFEMEKMRNLVLSLAPGTDLSKRAEQELVKG